MGNATPAGEVQGFVEAIHNNHRDRTTWLVLADWLGERGSLAERYCRARVALMQADPLFLPGSKAGKRRHAQALALARELWVYGPTDQIAIHRNARGVGQPFLPRNLPEHVKWIMWEDPGASDRVKGMLFLAHCRKTNSPRPFIRWLADISLHPSGPAFLQAFDLINDWATGRRLALDPAALAVAVDEAITEEDQMLDNHELGLGDSRATQLQELSSAVQDECPLEYLLRRGDDLSLYLPTFPEPQLGPTSADTFPRTNPFAGPT